MCFRPVFATFYDRGVVVADQYDLSRLSIFVVDHNAFMCRVFRTVLHAMRVDTVRVADSAASAMQELKNWTPDLIFVDLEAADITGLQLIRALRRTDNPARDCPIIMVPAGADAAVVRRARNAGAHYTLSKPFSPERIYRCMMQLRNEHRDFFETPTFYGPDRRRKSRAFVGPDRRLADAPRFKV